MSSSDFEITARNKVVRRPHRGKYDKATVYDILDAAMLCHIAYVIDGQPYCTPTAFWREGDKLYWHGSSASRMLRNQITGIPVCVTVTHMDSIALARCGFNHSINYRSVMAYGTATLIDDPQEKIDAMNNFIDRFFPGRTKLLRAATEKELKATSFVVMEMEQASGKIRNERLHDDEDDYAIPAWTAELPLRTVLGPITECPRQSLGVVQPPEMSAYQEGRRFDEIMLETYRQHYGQEG